MDGSTTFTLTDGFTYMNVLHFYHGKFISRPNMDGFPLNMGHLKALKNRQNSSGSYSNSRMQGLTSSYSNFEFYSYSLDALPASPTPALAALQCGKFFLFVYDSD